MTWYEVSNASPKPVLAYAMAAAVLPGAAASVVMIIFIFEVGTYAETCMAQLEHFKHLCKACVRQAYNSTVQARLHIGPLYTVHLIRSMASVCITHLMLHPSSSLL